MTTHFGYIQIRRLNAILVVFLMSIFLLNLPGASTRAAPAGVPPAPFLEPPYYGAVQVNCVYDHWYPLYHDEGSGDIASTVIHYDGTSWQGTFDSCTIGTPSCYSGHNGIDYDLEYELVRSAAPGDVVYAGWDNPAVHGGSPVAGLGLHVYLRHDNGYDTLYGHMSVLRVRTDDEGICEANEFSCILGISGNTGHSTGPHLHFELEPPGSTRSVNPYGWIGGTGEDPWENHPDGFASHDVWLRYPSITNGDVYPSGAPLHAPPIDENEPGYFIVDDGDTGFVENPAGCWTVDNTAGWANDHRYRDVPDGNCTARWNFPSSQSAGYYNVFVYVPNRNATTDAAQHTIRHTESSSRPWNKQTNRAVVNQLVYPNNYHPSSWVYVGTYYFNNQYGTDYVRLEAQPLNLVGTARMAADAVRFAPVVYRAYLPLVMKRWPPIPDTPVLNPIHNPDNDGNYTVSWRPAYLASTYILQEATNSSFVGAVTRYYGTGTLWSATNKPVGTYYYRVKARNSWGDSGWSNVQQTSVQPPSTLYAVEDTDVREGYPDDNYGYTYDMLVGYDDIMNPNAKTMYSLIRFDLSQIPPGAPIDEAILWVYMWNSYNGNGQAVEVRARRVRSWWWEGSVTWNSRPSLSITYDSALVEHADYRWYAFDITRLVRYWVNGTYPNYGVALYSYLTTPGWRAFVTREYPGYEPCLGIKHSGVALPSAPSTVRGTGPVMPDDMILSPTKPAGPQPFASPLSAPEDPNATPGTFRSPLPVPERP